MVFDQHICVMQMHTCSDVTDKALWFHTNMQRRHLVWDFIDVVHNLHSVREDLSRRNQLYVILRVPGTRYKYLKTRSTRTATPDTVFSLVQTIVQHAHFRRQTHISLDQSILESRLIMNVPK